MPKKIECWIDSARNQQPVLCVLHAGSDHKAIRIDRISAVSISNLNGAEYLLALGVDGVDKPFTWQLAHEDGNEILKLLGLHRLQLKPEPTEPTP